MTEEYKKKIMEKIHAESITGEAKIRCSLNEVSQRQCVYIDYPVKIKIMYFSILILS